MISGWSEREASQNWNTSAQIDNSIFVGGYLAAADPEHLRSRGITHVLKLFADDSSYPGGCVRHPRIIYGVVPAEDVEGFALDRYFGSCLKFIGGALASEGKVFVHCHMGVSRAPTICILYLMSFRGLSLAAAWRRVKACRPQAEPNPGFKKLLARYGAWQAEARRRWGGRPYRPGLA